MCIGYLLRDALRIITCIGRKSNKVHSVEGGERAVTRLSNSLADFVCSSGARLVLQCWTELGQELGQVEHAFIYLSVSEEDLYHLDVGHPKKGHVTCP